MIDVAFGIVNNKRRHSEAIDCEIIISQRCRSGQSCDSVVVINLPSDVLCHFIDKIFNFALNFRVCCVIFQEVSDVKFESVRVSDCGADNSIAHAAHNVFVSPFLINIVDNIFHHIKFQRIFKSNHISVHNFCGCCDDVNSITVVVVVAYRI